MPLYPMYSEGNIKSEQLRTYLSANIKARREALSISQEKLAEMADVSVQMIKRIEGRRTWVSDTMLEKLAETLGVAAFQLLAPTDAVLHSDSALLSVLLRNLRQNIMDDINGQFARVLTDDQQKS